MLSSSTAETPKKVEGMPPLSPPSSTVEARPDPTKRLRSAPSSIPGRGSSISPATSPVAVQEANPLETAASISKSTETVRANRVSRHVREGALSQIDAGVERSVKEVHDPAQALPGVNVSPDSFNDWKQTMEGMLDGERIEEDLHRELGIPVTSIGTPSGKDLAAASLERKPGPLTAEGDERASFDQDRGLRQSAVSPVQFGIANDGNGSIPTGPVGSAPQTSHSESPAPESMGIPDSHSIPRRSSFHQASQPGSNAISPPLEPQENPIQLHSPIAAPKALLNEAEDPELYGKMLATEIYHDNEAHIQKEEAAEYLGGV